MPVISSEFSSTVKNSGNNCSLLVYLSSRFTYKSKADWKSALDEGLIAVNGIRPESDGPVKDSDRISFKVLNYHEPEVPTDIRILEKSSGMVFVHKPAGLPVHRTGRVFFNTLVNLVRISEDNKNLSPLHRLDAETSGIVVFSDQSASIADFSNHSSGNFWLKNYLAVVPKISTRTRGVIDKPLGTLPGSRIRCQIYARTGGKASLSYFEELSSSSHYSLLAVTPLTGRRHQVRAHLACEGYPVSGDKIYSHRGKYYLKRLEKELGPLDYSELGGPHHKLHCFGIEKWQDNKRKIRIYDRPDSDRFSSGFIDSFLDWKNSEKYDRYIKKVMLLVKRKIMGKSFS